MKSERKRLVAELDRFFSLYIRKRGKNVCQICGSAKQPQCGHILSRVAYSVRWDMLNAICLCASCNIKMEHDVAHVRRVTDWYINAYGIREWEALIVRRNQARKWTTEELSRFIDYYQAQLKVLP